MCYLWPTENIYRLSKRNELRINPFNIKKMFLFSLKLQILHFRYEAGKTEMPSLPHYHLSESIFPFPCSFSHNHNTLCCWQGCSILYVKCPCCWHHTTRTKQTGIGRVALKWSMVALDQQLSRYIVKT